MWDLIVIGAINGLMGYQAYTDAQKQSSEDRDMNLWLQTNQQANQRPGSQGGGITRKTYECAGCGAPLFGVINENCQYCKRPAGSGA